MSQIRLYNISDGHLCHLSLKKTMVGIHFRPLQEISEMRSAIMKNLPLKMEWPPIPHTATVSESEFHPAPYSSRIPVP